MASDESPLQDAAQTPSCSWTPDAVVTGVRYSAADDSEHVSDDVHCSTPLERLEVQRQIAYGHVQMRNSISVLSMVFPGHHRAVKKTATFFKATQPARQHRIQL